MELPAYSMRKFPVVVVPACAAGASAAKPAVAAAIRRKRMARFPRWRTGSVADARPYRMRGATENRHDRRLTRARLGGIHRNKYGTSAPVPRRVNTLRRRPAGAVARHRAVGAAWRPRV